MTVWSCPHLPSTFSTALPSKEEEKERGTIALLPKRNLKIQKHGKYCLTVTIYLNFFQITLLPLLILHAVLAIAAQQLHCRDGTPVTF